MAGVVVMKDVCELSHLIQITCSVFCSRYRNHCIDTRYVMLRYAARLK